MTRKGSRARRGQNARPHRPGARPWVTWCPDADRLPPAPAPRRARDDGGALLHGGERRALPRGRGGRRDRGAGRLRARLPLRPGARRCGAIPFWEEQARDDLDAYCEFVRGAGLRLGVECDFVPGAEERTAELLAAREFDYVVGSVHFVGEKRGRPRGLGRLGGGPATPTRSGAATSRRSPSAPAAGLFDILAHPDLVKVWGRGRPLPERDPRHYYEPAVEAIAESGIAVELSTAGLRKPVGELYPARGFAELCVEAGAPFALSSDAHLPEQVGFGYDRALDFLAELGVGEIAVFERRERSLEPLPARVGED